MTKIEVSRTELVWPGKYGADGSVTPIPRVSLPFQTVETTHERRLKRPAEKEKPLSLFDVYTGDEGTTFEDGWKNKLIWGDNLLVMSSLLQNFAGKIDLIYMDPPFATEANFSMNVQIGEEGTKFSKSPSVIEEKAYNDTWGRGRDSWFVMIYDRLRLARELLSETGTLYLHLDWYVGHHLRPVLAEIFGEDQSLGEVIWSYGSPSGGRAAGAKLIKAHDMIFIFCKKHGSHTFNRAYLPYSERYINDWFRHEDPDKGKYQNRYRKDKSGKQYVERQYLCDSKGIPASTVWTDIQQLYADPRAYKPGMTSELTGYPTQKPEKLLERIIEISSDPGDLVADFFCGSGTTLAAAEKTGRRWIGCELGRWGVHVTRKRLLEVKDCKPFQLLNLGLYERQHWQGVTFDSGSDAAGGKDREKAMYEYIAFVLKLYRSEPLEGFQYIHGRRAGGVCVHVGAVDAPVTVGDIDRAIAECKGPKNPELHVLGWEWEMGLLGLIEKEARRRGVTLRLLQIPREVMEIDQVRGDGIRFFELAYLDCKLENLEERNVQLHISSFAIPNAEMIAKDIRDKISDWPDYIDYWAVDWNYQGDTFSQDFVAYRTRSERSLPLVSEPYQYDGKGAYKVLVKVIDIFGNDTTKQLDVTIK